jgi:hypothetical protein
MGENRKPPRRACIAESNIKDAFTPQQVDITHTIQGVVGNYNIFIYIFVPWIRRKVLACLVSITSSKEVKAALFPNTQSSVASLHGQPGQRVM